jgi:hypothetical protein
MMPRLTEHGARHRERVLQTLRERGVTPAMLTIAGAAINSLHLASTEREEADAWLLLLKAVPGLDVLEVIQLTQAERR